MSTLNIQFYVENREKNSQNYRYVLSDLAP